MGSKENVSGKTLNKLTSLLLGSDSESNRTRIQIYSYIRKSNFKIIEYPDMYRMKQTFFFPIFSQFTSYIFSNSFISNNTLNRATVSLKIRYFFINFTNLYTLFAKISFYRATINYLLFLGWWRPLLFASARVMLGLGVNEICTEVLHVVF